jgi:2-succinyl-5-enolpyruvyl-6-hydroxy-3-cyclohexene-1-carboxylate synthase
MSGGAHQDRTVRSLVAALYGAGVTDVLVAPGSRSTPLVQAVAELEALGAWTLQVILDERSAGFVATGLARGGRLPLLVCTSGTAVAQLLAACVEAGESGLGWLILSGDRPQALQGLGAPQTIRQRDLLATYAPCLHIEACDADLDAAQWQTALRRHVEPRLRGPVHLNVGLDLPLAMAADGAPDQLPPRTPASQLPGTPFSQPPGTPLGQPPGTPLSQPPGTAGRLPAPATNERTVVVAGPMPPGSVTAQVAQWLDAAAVVLHEVTANLPLQRTWTCYDATLRAPSVRDLLLPDRIVRLGEWPASKGLQLLLETAAQRGVPIDHVQGPRRSDPLRCNRWTVVGSTADALEPWATTPAAATVVTAWRDEWQRVEQAARHASQSAALQDLLAQTEAALVPLLLDHCVATGAALLVGNSMPVRDIDTFAGCGRAPPLYSVRGANGIDGTLATALGLATAIAPQPLTVYLGDGALLHDAGSLQLLAQRHDVALQVVVADNDGGAIFDYLPARGVLPADVHERCFRAAHGLDLSAIAGGFGLASAACASVEAAAPLLAAPLLRSRVVVVPTDPGRSFRAHRAWQDALQQAAIAATQRPESP